jgi:hypothetical protein
MMDAYLDDLLDELVPAEPRDAWDDVLHRARHSRRRYTALVAVVAALVLVPAAWAAVNAFEGTPAPPDVSNSFTLLNRMPDPAVEQGIAAKWPQADVSKAHGVIEIQTADGPEDLWAAPDDQGGQCYFIDWANDAPDQDGSAYGFGGGCGQSPQPASNISWGDVWVAGHPDLMTIWGTVYVDAATVRASLDDGSTLTLPVVEHAFLGSAPKGTDIAKLTALDANGNVVASDTPPASSD